METEAHFYLILVCICFLFVICCLRDSFLAEELSSFIHGDRSHNNNFAATRSVHPVANPVGISTSSRPLASELPRNFDRATLAPLRPINNPVLVLVDPVEDPVRGSGERSSSVMVGSVFKFRDNSCAICLEDFNQGVEFMILERCNHVFHKLCILDWLDEKKHCPICRRGFSLGGDIDLV